MCYADCIAQLVTRLDDSVVSQVDDLIADGVVTSRSDAVRQGLDLLVDRHRRLRVAAAITEGYRMQPQTEAEMRWSDEATARMIADEPW